MASSSASRKKKVRVTPLTGSSAPPEDHVGRAVANVTVGDPDALECGVCFLALRPPIFQCEVGHVVCSACRDKLVATGNGKCHVCRAATSGYRQCYAMERLVDCLHVPCPYAAHGCDATPPYHGLESHRQACPNAPCHCPGESCGFVGSTAELLDHFAGAHNWPCTNMVRAGKAFSINAHVGFNFILLADQYCDLDDGRGEQAVPCRLFLLNVTQEQLGHAISVLGIHPHAKPPVPTTQLLSRTTRCELTFTGCDGSSLSSKVFVIPVCTDLSSGLPSPEDCFKFVVSNAVQGDHHKDCSEVKLGVDIFFTLVSNPKFDFFLWYRLTNGS